jgi:AAA domain, putative AbiEii toxin, Type IV TA system
MLIQEVVRTSGGSFSGKARAFLVYDSWDDSGFKTTFDLVVFDNEGRRVDFGPVKIMQKGMQRGHVALPKEPFEYLGDHYCSLGQQQNYYELFANLHEIRKTLLRGLRDCVHDLSIFDQFHNEPAMGTSLMRSIDERTIREIFRGALAGQVSLTAFKFSYRFPKSDSLNTVEPPALTFSVIPGSTPATNIHAIIGRNSTGKTKLLWNITAILCRGQGDEVETKQSGELRFETDAQVPTEGRFSRLVTVAFSAFDPFRAPREGSISEGNIHYSYIGLKRKSEQGFERGQSIVTKNDQDLLDEFANSLANCSYEPRLQRWIDALALLEADPGFRDLSLASLMSIGASDRLPTVSELFQSLSSGHKIVLLTVTRLVELIDERTLVLIDEPESHLHPPLLASFVRVLSMLLMRRNGAAILATHSPVVLQEMPKSCVWVLRRSGDQITAERPLIETFGENVGVLTREVFGLETTLSGFHKMISNAVADELGNYDQVVEKFGGQLGSEARAIALALSRLRR